MVESVAQHYPNQIGRVNNLSSGVFNTANGLGEVVGPLFGAAMYETSGFRMTSDITSIITFLYVFVFVFILTNGIASIRHQIKKRTNKLDTAEESKDDADGKKNKYSKKFGKDDDNLNSSYDHQYMGGSSNGSESLLSSSDQHKATTPSSSLFSSARKSSKNYSSTTTI